jgi:hypothetical protein
MRLLGLLLLAVGMVLPVCAADPGKAPDKPGTRKAPAKKSAFAGQVSGKLVKRFPNAAEFARLKQDLDDLKGDLGGLQFVFDNFKQGQASAFGLVVPGRFFPVELVLASDVEVRLKEPPTQFDKKGNIVKPTGEMLRKLKGPDPSKPGYTGEKSDLREGLIVTVHYYADPAAGKTPAKPPPPKGKAPEMPKAAENRLLVGRVVVMEDPEAKKPGK